MKLSAAEFGKQHRSCILEERIEFDRRNPGKGQAGFYAACKNGGHLLWQLYKLSEDQLKPYRSSLVEVARRAAVRARKWASMTVVYDIVDADAYADYAAMDSANAANTAEKAAGGDAVFFVVRAATHAAKWAGQAAAFSGGRSRQHKELELQAYDIKELIPVWPGE